MPGMLSRAVLWVLTPYLFELEFAGGSAGVTQRLQLLEVVFRIPETPAAQQLRTLLLYGTLTHVAMVSVHSQLL